MKLSFVLASIAVTSVVASPCKPAATPANEEDGPRIKPTIVYKSDDATIAQPTNIVDPYDEDHGPRLTSLVIDPVPTGLDGPRMTSKIVDPAPGGPEGPPIKPTIVYDGGDARIPPTKEIQPTRAADGGAALPQSKAVQPTRGPDGNVPQMKVVDGSDRWL